MKLKVGDIIEVIGFVMMKNLNGGQKYRLSRIGTHCGKPVYWFTKAKGKKEVVGHYVSEVDLWVGTNNLNRIDILTKSVKEEKCNNCLCLDCEEECKRCGSNCTPITKCERNDCHWVNPSEE